MLNLLLSLFALGVAGAGLCRDQEKPKKRNYRKNNYSKKLYDDGAWFYDHGIKF